MVRVFGHFISLRAILFAIFETAAFVAFFNVFKVTALYYMFGEIQPLYGEAYLLPLFVVIAFATAASCGLYNKEMFSDPNAITMRLLTVAVLMYFLMAVVVTVAELLVENTPNLKVYFAVALGSSIGYLITALLFRLNVSSYNFNGTVLERRILVLGVDDCAAKIEGLNGSSRSPYRAVGFVPFGQEAKSRALSSYKIIPPKVMAQPEGLLQLARKLQADEIVVASRERRNLPAQALMECRLNGLVVTDFATFWERQTGQIDLDEVSPTWLIFSNGFRVSYLRQATKRCFDILIAMLVLIITSPIAIAAAIMIKLDSPGPVFYRQERVGARGQAFTIFKFRSMRTDAERDGVARWAQSNDSRVTRIGKFIRRTRVDELPQLFNVLLGDMSFVGPRPERPVFVESLLQKIPYYDVRHRVKPGLTGWAQINYPYGASDEDAKAKLAYDLYYVKNWNLFLDVVILFQTARVVLWQEGAR